MSEVILRMCNVDKSYNLSKPNEVRVLSHVNIEVAQGEAVALVAPSGAGKSTLLHIAGLLDTADAGSVQICGQEAQQMTEAARTQARRSNVGFVYQFHHLLPEFTAQENITLPQLVNAVPERDAQARSMALLASIGLRERADHRPAALSGGEQQRVAFCRALANRPKLLLADEPTGNLDPETSEKVFSAMMSLVREEGLAALVATHNPELAARMDRVVHLSRGALSDV